MVNMKAVRRLIALNLAILLILTLCPMSAVAAGNPTLTIGTPIETTELYDAGYSFTPAETGLYKFEVSCYDLTNDRPRACLKIGDVPSGEGFGAAGKQFFRGNPDGFQGKFAPSRGQKTRRLGMLIFFKQALAAAEISRFMEGRTAPP